MRKAIYAIMFFVILPSSLLGRLGGAGGTFLSRAKGTIAPAMGYAYSAYAKGIEAIFWNPAGLASVKVASYHITYTQLFAGLRETNLAFVYPLPVGTIGVDIVASLSGEILRTTPEAPKGTGDYFTANDYAFGIAFGRNLTDKFSAGFNIKVVNLNIDKVTSWGIAIDIGAIYNTRTLRNLRFGFSLQNFARDMTYYGEALQYTVEEGERMATYLSTPFPLPLTFQTGIAIDLIDKTTTKCSFAADLIHPLDQRVTFGVGIECILGGKFAIRVGYTGKNNHNFTYGFGILGDHISINYAYENHQYLTGEHRLGVNLTI